MTDAVRRELFVHGIEARASVGILNGEQDRFQDLILDIEVDLGAHTVHGDDTPEVDYRSFVDIVAKVTAAGHTRLIETIAERVAQACAQLSGTIERVAVTVRKPGALAPAMAGTKVILVP